MKKVFNAYLISVFMILAICFVPDVEAATGITTIAKWKDNKQAAFSLMFDDSTVTQADNAMPAMIQRGLVGTWFINPGTERYKSRQNVWEQTAIETGQDLAVHTMTHGEAYPHRVVPDYETAEWEIGACAEYIWSIRPPGASKLSAFASGGGTTWPISSAEMREIASRYYLAYRSGAGINTGAKATTLINYAQNALNNGRWQPIYFHGIGGDWVPVSVEDFTQLLDYLVSIKDKLWIDAWTAVHKYTEERNTASVSILETTNSTIRLNLTSAKDPTLYDEALTLMTEIPSNWSSCTASQAGQSKPCSVVGGKAQYDAVPSKGQITLTPAGTPTPTIPSSPLSLPRGP